MGKPVTNAIGIGVIIEECARAHSQARARVDFIASAFLRCDSIRGIVRCSFDLFFRFREVVRVGLPKTRNRRSFDYLDIFQIRFNERIDLNNEKRKKEKEENKR